MFEDDNMESPIENEEVIMEQKLLIQVLVNVFRQIKNGSMML